MSPIKEGDLITPTGSPCSDGFAEGLLWDPGSGGDVRRVHVGDVFLVTRVTSVADVEVVGPGGKLMGALKVYFEKCNVQP